MACRILDLIVDKATNLKDVTHINKMEVYVVVSLDESPRCTQLSKSPVDVGGGINPTWSFSVKLYVDEPSAQENRLNIHFKLRCDNRFGDRDVGEVVVPVKKLLDSAAAHGKASTVTYSVCRPSGKLEGKLHFSYKFSDKLTAEGAYPGPQTMACRILDLTVDKATNLKAVTHINKMKVYVVVSLDESPHCTQVSKSPVDVDGGIDPTWSFSVKLYVDEPSAQENRLNIHFKLLCDNHFGDSDVGEVVVPVKKLLDSAAAHGEASTVTYSVCRPFGRLEGKLHFSYKFSDKLTAEVGSPGRSAAPKADGAPPVVDAPPADRVDGQPTPPGNGDYPNQQAQQVPKKNRMGLGLEAGVALGRLVIECALEAADAADAI